MVIGSDPQTLLAAIEMAIRLDEVSTRAREEVKK